MLVVGAISGTVASKIIKGFDMSLLASSLLGIAGAVVGATIFNFLNITPGAGIASSLSKTFQVEIPTNILGMIVSAVVGSLLILFAVKLIRGGIGKRRKK